MTLQRSAQSVYFYLSKTAVTDNLGQIESSEIE